MDTVASAMFLASATAWAVTGIGMVRDVSPGRVLLFLFCYAAFFVSSILYAMIAEQHLFLLVPIIVIFCHYYSFKVVNDATKNS